MRKPSDSDTGTGYAREAAAAVAASVAMDGGETAGLYKLLSMGAPALGAIVNLLNSPDRETRRNAAIALITIVKGQKDFWYGGPAFGGQLQPVNRYSRALLSLLKPLLELSSTERILVRAARLEPPEVRKCAAMLLKFCPTKRAVQALCGMLGDRSYLVKAAVRESFLELMNTTGEVIFARLPRERKDKTIELLNYTTPPGTLLDIATTSDDPELRGFALSELGRLLCNAICEWRPGKWDERRWKGTASDIPGGRRSAQFLYENKDRIIRMLGDCAIDKNENPEIRAAAVNGLRWLPGRLIFPCVIELCRSRDLEIAPCVDDLADGLQAILGDYQPRELQGILEVRHPKIQRAAIRELGWKGFAAATPRLREFLTDKSAATRLEAVKALILLNNEAGYDKLKDLMLRPDRYIVEDCLFFLAGRIRHDSGQIWDRNHPRHYLIVREKLKEKDFVAPLLDILLAGKDKSAVSLSIEILGCLGSRKALPAIQRFLAAPEFTLEAVYALAEINDGSAYACIRGAMEATHDPCVFSAGLLALIRVGCGANAAELAGICDRKGLWFTLNAVGGLLRTGFRLRFEKDFFQEYGRDRLNLFIGRLIRLSKACATDIAPELRLVLRPDEEIRKAVLAVPAGGGLSREIKKYFEFRNRGGQRDARIPEEAGLAALRVIGEKRLASELPFLRKLVREHTCIDDLANETVRAIRLIEGRL